LLLCEICYTQQLPAGCATSCVLWFASGLACRLVVQSATSCVACYVVVYWFGVLKHSGGLVNVCFWFLWGNSLNSWVVCRFSAIQLGSFK